MSQGGLKLDVKVSVIVPVYNNEEYLPQCLESICSQTLRDIEIIVVNDGSTDRSLDIMRMYAGKDERIHIIDKPNAGYGDSMNRGLAAAQGEYIGIVESDDFIDSGMYEHLYALSDRGTVDVIKGNFYDYYCSPEGKEHITPNKERDSIQTSEAPFILRENGGISWCHPSIWSAIYRRAFLVKHNIHFIEAKGGGWVDNPFFYETLGLAESIMWTQQPYYYYRRDNPDSSSNHQSDVRIPFQRMLENLDVLEENGYHYDEATKYAHGRALLYLKGVLHDFDYDANEQTIAANGAAVMRRLDPEVLAGFDLYDRSLYYTYASPMRGAAAGQSRILLYSSQPYAAKSSSASDIRAFIDTILEERPDVSVYVLSSGHAYDAARLETYTRKALSPMNRRLHIYEIVNSPVPAEGRCFVKNPSALLSAPALVETIKRFLDSYGPFDVVHFLGHVGLSADVFSLRAGLPGTRFVLSLREFLRCGKKFIISEGAERGSFAHALYESGMDSASGTECVTEALWTKIIQLDRLDRMAGPAEDVRRTWRTAINGQCDSLIATSENMADIAKEHGFDEDRIMVVPAGTKVAAYQLGSFSAPLRPHLMTLAALAYDESSYLDVVTVLLSVPERAARRINLSLFLTQEVGGETVLLKERYHTLKCVELTDRMSLPSLLYGLDLALTSQEGGGTQPWMAAAAIASGVPVLIAGHACAETIAAFALQKKAIRETMTLPVLPTMSAQVSGMLKAYGLPVLPEKFAFSPEEFFYLQQEHDFLLRQMEDDIANGVRVAEQAAHADEMRNIIDKNQIILDTCQVLFAKSQTDESLARICERRGMQSVILYGYGVLGKAVYRDLLDSHIRIVAIMDSFPERVHGAPDGMAILHPRDKADVGIYDAVLVTAVGAFSVIRDDLIKRGYHSIYNVADLVGHDVGALPSFGGTDQ